MFPFNLFRREARPTDEAVTVRDEVKAMRPRVERVVKERQRLLDENNYTARIRELYKGEAT